MRVNILFSFLILLGIIIVDIQTMFFMMFVYIFGVAIVSLLNKRDKNILIKIYKILFFTGASYMLACYVYMTYHDYSYLFSFDSVNAFLPNTENYLKTDGYISTVKSIWKDFIFLDRNINGYYTYATTFGYIGNIINVKFYIGQQISVLFLYSFVGIILYKLFLINNFDRKKSYKYTLIISCFSIIFFFSSMITRDIHILLFYLLAIYFSFNKDYTDRNLLKLVLVILVCSIFRVESGLFLLILIPNYLLLSLQQQRGKNIVLIISAIVLIVLIPFLISNYNTINIIFEKNQENYIDHIVEGSGVISTLQKVPIAGDFASIIYNAAQPLPFWAHFTTPKGSDRVEMYNIMSFPESFASFFNWFVIVYILFWLFSKNLKKKTKGYISKPMQYNLWIGLVFLFIQSAVIAQRRLMGYYCLFYIFFFIIYNHIGVNDKKQITFIAILSFFALQIFSYIYLS